MYTNKNFFIDQSHKGFINEKAKEKYALLSKQKLCIAKYKKLQKYFETVDFDHIDTKEQNKLLHAYLFCQHDGKYNDFKDFTAYIDTKGYDFDRMENVTSFDLKKFASTLMGIPDCKETYIWLDKTFLECNSECWDYDNVYYYMLERKTIHVVCPSDFDDKKQYSQKEILELAKAKKIFLFGFGSFSSRRFYVDYRFECPQIKIKSGNSKTTEEITLAEDYSQKPKKITIPAGTRLEEKKFNSKPFDCFCSWKKTLEKNKLNPYLEHIQQLYPNFVTVYLKQLADELPKEISARIRQAKQTHKQIKTFIEESYAEYRIALENELQKVESDRQKQLDEVKTEPKYDESKFEF